MMTLECDACGVKWWPAFADVMGDNDFWHVLDDEGWRGLESPDGRGRCSLLCKNCNAQYEGGLVPVMDTRRREVERVMLGEWLQSRRARSSVLSDLDLLPCVAKEEA